MLLFKCSVKICNTQCNKVHLPCIEFYLVLRRLKQSVILIGQALFCMYGRSMEYLVIYIKTSYITDYL
jgi:hypothetical protein